jgi:hypothetical protein
MSKTTIAALGLSLALLLGGCAQGTEPEAAPEPAAVETQDSGYGEMATEPEPEAAAEATEAESEAVEPEAAGESEQENTSTTTASPTATASPSASPSPTESAAPTPEPDPGFTLAEVATRNTASNCWVAISGNVYDLTDWIAGHPGGPGAITQLCGRDGTTQFQGRHGGQSLPLSTLAGYLVGPLR